MVQASKMSLDQSRIMHGNLSFSMMLEKCWRQESDTRIHAAICGGIFKPPEFSIVYAPYAFPGTRG